MKQTVFALLFILLLGHQSSASENLVFPIIGLDPGVGNVGAAINSNIARFFFEFFLNIGCWNIRRYNYDNQPIGALTFTEDNGNTLIKLIGDIIPGTSGIQSTATVATDAILGFPTSDGQFIRISPDGTNGESQLSWSFSDSNVLAWGTYITGLGSSPSTLTIEFDNGANDVIPIPGSPFGGILFVGVFSATPISKVTVVFDTAFDIIGFDDTISAIFIPLPISTTPVAGKYLIVNNLNQEKVTPQTCEKGVTYPVAKTICECLHTDLADIVFADFFNPAFNAATQGFQTCGGRTIFKDYWIGSYNGQFGGSPLQLRNPSITVVSPTTLEGVICNKP